MELEVTYNPDISNIDVLKDVKSLLNQLSGCYNSKINALEQEIIALKKERAGVIKALEEKNYKGLNAYFEIQS